MQISWSDVHSTNADSFDSRLVEITGWMAPPSEEGARTGFLLKPEPTCCTGCLPGDPLATVEVIGAHPIAHHDTAVQLAGRWCVLADDPAGWRYQLRDAALISVETPPLPAFPFTRRAMLAAGALIGLAACQTTTTSPSGDPAPKPSYWPLPGPTIDIHSHAGRLLPGRSFGKPGPFEALANPMRDGGMTAICLSIVADTPVHVVTADRRIKTVRAPEPGELYAWSRTAFARLFQLVDAQRLGVVSTAADFLAARSGEPAVIVSAEGADFLEGEPDRIDEAHATHRLRHLQLTHYRVNELGDIQTEAPVHGGLTDLGADVIRRCNRLGIVVDVAHGTLELAKRAAAVTSKPLVLSHTSLATDPPPRSRRITPDHARVIAGTGGVIGIWPPVPYFPDLPAFAAGIARMADVVGVDHVGLGSDMLGLLSPSAFSSYRQLPELAASLSRIGFQPDEVGRILGGNYARVFAASVG